MTLGVPISFSVGIASVVATLLLPGVDNATIVQRMLTSLNTFPLLAVIFFVFAGTLMARGGIARRLVLMAEVLVGWLPGSLAQIVCVASMFFGGVTGSAVAEVSSIGAMMIPAMVKDGYSRRFATAIVLTAATMGPIIPPSIGMIIYAHIAGSVSIAALFLAGVIPGVLIGISLMAASFVHGRLYHRKVLPQLSQREKVRRVHHGDHPWRDPRGRVHRDRGRCGGLRLRDASHRLRVPGNQVAGPPRDHLAMLPDKRRGDAPDRHLFGVLVDPHLREPAPHAGGQLLQPDPGQVGVPADPEPVPAGGRHVRRHDPGPHHAGADPDSAGAAIRLRPGSSGADHGHQSLLRPDHAAGRHRVVRRLQGGRDFDGKADPAAAAAARLHAGGAAGSHVLARDLLVAAAQLRAGEIAVIRGRLVHAPEAVQSARTAPGKLTRAI